MTAKKSSKGAPKANHPPLKQAGHAGKTLTDAEVLQQGAASKAMVQPNPEAAAAPPPVDQPLTAGAITTTGALNDSREVAAEAETAKGSRDETHDSIDPNTGTLTEDAVARRAELAAKE
jgi:hypothetical protein